MVMIPVGVNGVDDLLAKVGPGAVLAQISIAKKIKPIRGKRTVMDPETAGFGPIRRLAAKILKTDYFAKDAGGMLYIYRDGFYQVGGKAFIEKKVKAILEDLEMDSEWSSHHAAEVAAYIGVDARQLWDRPPCNLINLKNGLFDIEKGRLFPHSADHLSPIQIPVSFDPNATCPAYDKFVDDTFPVDARALAYEIPAWLMVTDMSIQKAILATGEGGNGKSRALAAWVAYIGKRNCSAVSLNKLESDRFSVARLVGKLANICADLPSEHLESTSTFKALTGGDTMLAERKYADSFEIVPFAKLVFSANHPPRSADASHAFFRRWLVIPFDRNFEGVENIPKEILDARLAHPAEQSGILNKALSVLPSLLRNGFSESDTVLRARDEFRQVTDPLAVWLDQETVDHSFAEVHKKSLLTAYNDYAVKAGRPPMNQQGFGRALRRLRPSISEAQRGSAQIWTYVGIGLKSAEGGNDSVH